jgi:uncharacterized protein YndB with AHSA1/START domain
MLITETAYFDCPRERLFRHIEEPEKQKLWMKGLLANESTSLGPRRVGSTFRMVIQEGGKPRDYDGEVTAYDKPSRLEVCFWGGCFPAGMKMRVDYRLSAEGGRTRLDYTAASEGRKPPWWMRLMCFFMKPLMRMQLRSFLRTLRGLVEAPPAQAA